MSRMLAAAVAATAFCLLPACGSEEESVGRGGTVVLETTDPSPDRVAIAAPATVAGGVVRVSLRNRGDTLHDAQLFRVDGRRSAADVVSVLEGADSAPKPGWLHPAGGVGAVGPGRTATATQVLEPGRYFVADTQERKAAGVRVTNAAKRGIVRLDVKGEGGGSPPAAPATIAATDDGFEANGLRPGDNRVTFENRGSEFHQAVALPIAADIPFERAERQLLLDEADSGWVPVDVPSTRATAVLEGGAKLVTELRLPPGRYALVCFASDRAGGSPHLQEGMVSELNVSSETARQDAAAR